MSFSFLALKQIWLPGCLCVCCDPTSTTLSLHIHLASKHMSLQGDCKQFGQLCVSAKTCILWICIVKCVLTIEICQLMIKKAYRSTKWWHQIVFTVESLRIVAICFNNWKSIQWLGQSNGSDKISLSKNRKLIKQTTKLYCRRYSS